MKIQIRNSAYGIFMGIFVALCVRFYFFTPYSIPTGSMRPNLIQGDFIFAFRKAYQFLWPEWMQFGGLPQRGDVVVFTFPNKQDILYIKRVMGLPGDRIEIENGKIVLNNKRFEYELHPDNESDFVNPNLESFTVMNEKSPWFKAAVILQKNQVAKKQVYDVPEGHVFVLGDNRSTSEDSRDWGTVPYSHIIGKASWIWLSLSSKNAKESDSSHLTNFSKIKWDRIFKRVN